MSPFYKDFNNIPKINCNIDLIRSRFDLKESEYFHTIFDKENHIWLSSEFENWLAKFDLFVKRIELFHTEPNRITGWHIDMNPPRDWIKINWVYENGTSFMEWGQKNTNDVLSNQITMAGTSYVRFESEAVDRKCRHKLIGPTLINAGRPHRIDNNKSSDRWCISTIILKKKELSRLSWIDALHIFRDYLI